MTRNERLYLALPSRARPSQWKGPPPRQEETPQHKSFEGWGEKIEARFAIGSIGDNAMTETDRRIGIEKLAEISAEFGDLIDLLKLSDHGIAAALLLEWKDGFRHVINHGVRPESFGGKR